MLSTSLNTSTAPSHFRTRSGTPSSTTSSGVGGSTGNILRGLLFGVGGAGRSRPLSPASISRIALTRHLDWDAQLQQQQQRSRTPIPSTSSSTTTATLTPRATKKASAAAAGTTLQLPRFAVQRASLPEAIGNGSCGAGGGGGAATDATGRRATFDAQRLRRGSAVAACRPTPSIMDVASDAGLLALAPSDLVFESSALGVAYYDFVLSAAPIFRDADADDDDEEMEKEQLQQQRQIADELRAAAAASGVRRGRRGTNDDVEAANSTKPTLKALSKSKQPIAGVLAAASTCGGGSDGGSPLLFAARRRQHCLVHQQQQQQRGEGSGVEPSSIATADECFDALATAKNAGIGFFGTRPSTTSLFGSIGGGGNKRTSATANNASTATTTTTTGSRCFVGRSSSGPRSLPNTPRPSVADISVNARALQQQPPKLKSASKGGGGGGRQRLSSGNCGVATDAASTTPLVGNQHQHSSEASATLKAMNHDASNMGNEECAGGGGGGVIGYRLFLAKLDAHTNVEWFETATVSMEVLQRNDLPASDLALITMGVLVWGRVGRLQDARLLCLVNGLGDDCGAALEALKRAATRYRCMPHVIAVGQRRRSSTGSTCSQRSTSSDCSSHSSSCATTTTTHSANAATVNGGGGGGGAGCWTTLYKSEDAGMRLRVMMCQSRTELPGLSSHALREARFLLSPNPNPLLCLCFPLT